MVQELASLPVHPAPPRPADEGWALTVDGLVARPGTLSLEQLAGLPHGEVLADFACEEGWQVPGLRWQGTPFAAILEWAGVSADARFAAFAAGDFVSVIPLSELQASRALLATHIDGEPLAWEHGGPLRLALAAGACYQSVKWVARITLCATSDGDTARAIAFERIGRPAGAGN
jgi:DMSO/TMAO reductase YedYZ molybdopterin-dependent catalytic subunit